jgi:hypothetical protein
MVQQLKTARLSPLQTILAAAFTAIAAGITSPLIIHESKEPAQVITREEVQSLSGKITELQVKMAESGVITKGLKDDVVYMRDKVDQILDKVNNQPRYTRGR